MAQKVYFNHDLSPAEGIIKPVEKGNRDEICLNGRWDFQPIELPKDWKLGTGIPPELPPPDADRWDDVKIKIPSPWNVNTWGAGRNVGKNTNAPYAPSSVYYPSYPSKWDHIQMGWLRRSFTVPESWNKKRLVLHFEAVMGDVVILVNNKKVHSGFHDYLPFDVDITDAARAGAGNELLVGVRHRRLFDKTDSRYPYFRTTYPPGSNTDNLVGIWQDVFLLALPPVRVNNIFIQPWVDKDSLICQVQLVNQTSSVQKITVGTTVKQWINLADTDIIHAPEIKWKLDDQNIIQFPSKQILIQPNSATTINLNVKVNRRLKYWEPESPNLYTAVVDVKQGNKTTDIKSQRFGWRQLLIKGRWFYLNGHKIQCFADIQHPFGAYVCSRRFAWAWFKMIKEAGGNAVRLHAQPWPSCYLDLADEMGLMVLDEAALFGSSLALNFADDSTWARTARHIDDFVLRDRNHPSVIGWSAGNELFAITLYNKPDSITAQKWINKSIAIARRPAQLDPTRSFITDDGDEDMHGMLPVWSKHFGHGLNLDRLPQSPNKPLIVGESGATYYGRPSQLFPFVGNKAYASYYGRNEALAIDLYQNIVKMARPYLAYFSPSELSWFGIEQLGVGYHDYSRLPDSTDGVFAGKTYEEDKPGYQMERIPPFVSTFNPGLDSSLPLFKPLPMFYAVKAALAKNGPAPCEWDHYQDITESITRFSDIQYSSAFLIGNQDSAAAVVLQAAGLFLTQNPDSTRLVIIDGDHVTNDELNKNQDAINRIQQNGGLLWIILSGRNNYTELKRFLPHSLQLISYPATSLQPDKEDAVGKYFTYRDLYFAEIKGDNDIIKTAITGDILKQVNISLKPALVDWSLFNDVGENKKCAQVVLYEKLKRPEAAAFITFKRESGTVAVSVIDPSIVNLTTVQFWQQLCKALAIKMNDVNLQFQNNQKKQHNLLLDGPVN